MTIRYEPEVQQVPIKRIRILNPRDRGKRKFAQNRSQHRPAGAQETCHRIPRCQR